MSANDYYNGGKPQEQGGYYPPQGTFTHFPNPRAASPVPTPNFARPIQHLLLWKFCYFTLAHLLLCS
jgi:hypothetical protein